MFKNRLAVILALQRLDQSSFPGAFPTIVIVSNVQYVIRNYFVRRNSHWLSSKFHCLGTKYRQFNIYWLYFKAYVIGVRF